VVLIVSRLVGIKDIIANEVFSKLRQKQFGLLFFLDMVYLLLLQNGLCIVLTFYLYIIHVV